MPSAFRKLTPNIGKGELILLIISPIITFLILEASARVWLNFFATPAQKLKYSLYTDMAPLEMWMARHHYLGFTLTPNYKKGLTYHNSLGYRDKEFPIKKPNGEYRIVVLGASAVYTTGAGSSCGKPVDDNEKTFPSQLENLLKSQYGYNHVKVINAGVPGYNSYQMLMNLEFRVLDLEPDLIIIYEGVNDIGIRIVKPSSYSGDNSGHASVFSPPVVKFYEHSCLFRIILWRDMGPTLNAAMSNNPNIIPYSDWDKIDLFEVLKLNPPIYYERNLKNMIAICKEHKIKVMLATYAHSTFCGSQRMPHYEHGYKQHNLIMKNLGETHNVPVFDYAYLMPNEKRYWADAIHVNETGALLTATLFAKFIHDNEGNF